jgi:hypothetical protein
MRYWLCGFGAVLTGFGPAHATTVLDGPEGKAWGGDPVAIALPDAFSEIVNVASGAVWNANLPSASEPAAYSLASLFIVLVAVLWIVRKLPTSARGHFVVRQASLAAVARLRMR